MSLDLVFADSVKMSSYVSRSLPRDLDVIMPYYYDDISIAPDEDLMWIRYKLVKSYFERFRNFVNWFNAVRRDVYRWHVDRAEYTPGQRITLFTIDTSNRIGLTLLLYMGGRLTIENTSSTSASYSLRVWHDRNTGCNYYTYMAFGCYLRPGRSCYIEDYYARFDHFMCERCIVRDNVLTVVLETVSSASGKFTLEDFDVVVVI